MSPRHQKTQRARSLGPPMLSGGATQRGSGDSGRMPPPITSVHRTNQLIPYSPWRVILYRRNTGQVVLYNQEDDHIKLQNTIPRSLGYLPQSRSLSAHQQQQQHRQTPQQGSAAYGYSSAYGSGAASTSGATQYYQIGPPVQQQHQQHQQQQQQQQQSGALTTAPRDDSDVIDLQVEEAHFCPTCLQLVPGQTTANSWRPLTSSASAPGEERKITADRDYFSLLARSLRRQQSLLALEDGDGDRQQKATPRRALRLSVDSYADDVNDNMDIDDDNDGKIIEEESPIVPPFGKPDHGAERGAVPLFYENDSAGSGSGDGGDGGGVSAGSFNQGYYERFFTEQKKLGKGLRGSVFSCQHILDGVYLGHYAVKKVAVGNNHKWLRRMLREVKLLETLRHSNVVEYKHSWLEMHQLTNFGPRVPCLFILMEYANGGNLQEYMEPKAPAIDTGDAPMSIKQQILRKRRLSRMDGGEHPSKPADSELAASEGGPRMLSIEHIWSFFADICNGLAHLHQLQIIHRDLKHMNLLLQWKNPNNKETSGEIPRIMLTDFGECEILSHLEKRDRTGATGTMEFMAPELLKVDDTGRFLDSYSTKSDMWSLGMVLYYLCYTRLPFTDIDDIDLLRRDVLKLKNVDFSRTQRASGAEEIPLDLRRIMQQLLQQDEYKRPDVGDILHKVNEHRNLWYSRFRDESRFELHDSDMASNFGGDTPGMRTPKAGSARNAVNSEGVLARSLALVRPQEGQHVPFGLLRGNGASIEEPKPSSPFISMIRRHSVDGSSRSSSRAPSVSRGSSLDLSDSSTSEQEDSWMEFEQIEERPPQTKDMGSTQATANLSSENIPAVGFPDSGNKRDLVDSSELDEHVSKRARPAAGLFSAAIGGNSSSVDIDIDPAFCTKTAILLAKVYALQSMVSRDTGDRSDFNKSVPVLMGLTLILSALDIHQQSSLQVTLILLFVNIGIVYLGLYF
ncbi:putative serine/threonine-protein kinase iks1 [Coemansia sp. Benny D115]|nr:putative serine/threonine-protein kinase iks1 [Coemansia sp. Benny D115]